MCGISIGSYERATADTSTRTYKRISPIITQLCTDRYILFGCTSATFLLSHLRLATATYNGLKPSRFSPDPRFTYKRQVVLALPPRTILDTGYLESNSSPAASLNISLTSELNFLTSALKKRSGWINRVYGETRVNCGNLIEVIGILFKITRECNLERLQAVVNMEVSLTPAGFWKQPRKLHCERFQRVIFNVFHMLKRLIQCNFHVNSTQGKCANEWQK